MFNMQEWSTKLTITVAVKICKLFQKCILHSTLFFTVNIKA